MKVLFIGGTGIISSACSRLALEGDVDLHLLNRGQTTHRPIPAGARLIQADINDPASAQAALGEDWFDVVVDWVAYTPDQVERDIRLFADRAGQYVFISSASAYQKPISMLPITESTPLYNPFWGYSRNKIACEERLAHAYREQGFPITIVRPSHTYDRTLFPFHGGYTMIARARQGKPMLVHGDGTSLWVLTHHTDFARGFVPLLGNPHALGETFHITSDELLSWNQIYTLLAQAAGVEPELVHVPSEVIARFDPDWGEGLLGDKSHSVMFDNTKIKRIVPGYNASIPFARGAREIIDWYDAHPDLQVVEPDFDRLVDRIIEEQRSAFSNQRSKI